MGSWGELFGVLGKGALVIGALAINEMIEDERLTELCTMPMERAVVKVAQMVPPMDNDTWQMFRLRMRRKAEYYSQAGDLLYFAEAIVRAENEVKQLVELDIEEGTKVAYGLMRGKNDVERFGFFVAMHSSDNIRAKAMLGNLLEG